MGDGMNTAQLDRFNRFFDDHYPTILAEVAESDPSGAVRRTRSGFASAYRFWSKVEADGDPVGWVHRVIAEDRRNPRHAAGRDPVDEAGDRASVEASMERRRIVALARRQRAVARVVLGTSAFVALGAKLFVAHR
jgi:hypothetical protein